MREALWQTRYVSPLCVQNSSLPSLLASIFQTDYAANAVAILRAIGLEDIAQKLLAEDGVHGLGNLLSLEPVTHSMFDDLDLWLEGTDEVRYSWTLQQYQPNAYAAQPLQCLRF